MLSRRFHGQHHSPMPIPNIIGLVTRAWTEAEDATIERLFEKHWDKDEEFVTEYFCDELRSSVQALAKTDAIVESFLQDLYDQFPELQSEIELRWLASGISATTTFHPREVEKNTGGDIGIVLYRPSVESGLDGNTLEIHQDHARGILCQAKISRRPQRRSSVCWGSLTPRQKEVLASKTQRIGRLHDWQR